MFSHNICFVPLCPLPLALLLDTTEKSPAPFSLYFPYKYPFRYLYTLMKRHQGLSEHFFPLKSHSSQPCRIGEMLQFLLHFSSLFIEMRNYIG